jgi:hypothetical protein
MKIEDIIINSENKIYFLKAILLGIKYGKMENCDFYEKSILNEIKKSKNSDSKYTNNLINKIDNKINLSKLLKKKNDLENLRNNIIKNINNLSYNNFNTNYVKINVLRNHLFTINQELNVLNNDNHLNTYINKISENKI